MAECSLNTYSQDCNACGLQWLISFLQKTENIPREMVVARKAIKRSLLCVAVVYKLYPSVEGLI